MDDAINKLRELFGMLKPEQHTHKWVIVNGRFKCSDCGYVIPPDLKEKHHEKTNTG